jgi:uncharacterized damage-inducible protein DinB
LASDVQDLTKRIRASRRALMSAAEEASGERLVKRPSEGEWSVLEILAHLVDVDYHYLAQAQGIHKGPDYTFVRFDDDRWKAEHANVREEPFARLLGELETSHKTVLDALSRISDAELRRTGKRPDGSPLTVRDVFERMPAHDENHTKQIREILAVV